MKASENAIVVSNLQKSFKQVHVLRGIDFTVKKGTVLALLGPNGAGKTTTVRILSTLLLPDKGEIQIAGYDIVKDADKVKASIGLTGQFAAVDEYLTAEENLKMIGRLYRLSHEDVARRTEKLLKQFDLVDAAKRPVKTYSGGMKRRIDLAMSLIASPPIIFLDEPTTGLDPRSRLTMWKMIKALVADGTTVLLTTQYMDEADQLADDIIVIDNGKVIAQGTPDTLKKQAGADRLEITLVNKSDLAKAEKLVDEKSLEVDSESRILSVATKGGVKKLKQLLDKFEKANIAVETVSLQRPTLDDVFLNLTGHKASKEEEGKKHE